MLEQETVSFTIPRVATTELRAKNLSIWDQGRLKHVETNFHPYHTTFCGDLVTNGVLNLIPLKLVPFSGRTATHCSLNFLWKKSLDTSLRWFKSRMKQPKTG